MGDGFKASDVARALSLGATVTEKVLLPIIAELVDVIDFDEFSFMGQDDSGIYLACTSCWNKEINGHKKDCRLVNVLSKAREILKEAGYEKAKTK